MFFVTTLEEAVQLKEVDQSAKIVVLGSTPSNAWREVARLGVISVVNSLSDLERAKAAAIKFAVELELVLNIDTGLNRLGVTPKELARLAFKGAIDFPLLKWTFLMTHLARPEESSHDSNLKQLQQLTAIHKVVPSMPVSLVNSAGIFLPDGFHFDVARPGIGLFGSGKWWPERRAVTSMYGRALQVRDITSGDEVGYGGDFVASQNMAIAIIAGGYGDGLFRAAGVKRSLWWKGIECPVIGRVSMDVTTVDATAACHQGMREGDWLEFFGPTWSVDNLAEAMATLPNELLSRIGPRVCRVYLP